MKKFALALVLVFCFACVASAELTEPAKLIFAAQEVGTGAYSVSAAIQGALLKGLPAGSTIDLTTNSPGGVGAPVLIQRGRADMIVGNAGPALWSYEKSKDDYQFGGCPDVRSIAGGLGHAMANIMFTKKFVDATGCTTMEEVIEKKVPIKLITKKNGTLGELTAERVIEACGISVEDFLKFATWEKTGTDAIKSGIQDDLYDATIDHVDAGQATTTEICLTHDMHFVQLKDETLANLNKMGYAPIVMLAGTWNKQEKDINTMGSQQNLIVPASMNDDVAYALAKALCENKDEIAAAVASLKWFDPKTAGRADLNGAPLHPGAAKYYKEMGYAFE
ncbi:MAG: TAXI family TRAP transporter solute-binding subunit [Synergistaceae bacterium]|nr:TAXI family TRAP transporter solute-binding subunit [Synergistaceae bacterium]MBQ9404749.1 TAXI family TRAP transporter solute-binding subunit [Synergistaceae bacterium]MBQ9595173.1 TAXI family TRAP transporter solute-binding subunit [Synergistaceae bacterium]MBR0205050.1 TAXI family TRAP transporter solute-binding subunit [Synergistaceae bacterium]